LWALQGTPLRYGTDSNLEPILGFSGETDLTLYEGGFPKPFRLKNLEMDLFGATVHNLYGESDKAGLEFISKFLSFSREADIGG